MLMCFLYHNRVCMSKVNGQICRGVLNLLGLYKSEATSDKIF
jgi:hypothetical protein